MTRPQRSTPDGRAYVPVDRQRGSRRLLRGGSRFGAVRRPAHHRLLVGPARGRGPLGLPGAGKLWSYSDLIALRVVSCLRHAKTADIGDLPASPMPQVRQALKMLDEYNTWTHGATARQAPHRCWSTAAAGSSAHQRRSRRPARTAQLDTRVLELTAPFTSAGGDGPDQLRPRPHLRVVPAKFAGDRTSSAPG